MLKLGRVTNVKVPFLVLVFVFNFNLFKFSSAILEKGLLVACSSSAKVQPGTVIIVSSASIFAQDISIGAIRKITYL